MERVQKVLARCGVASRRASEQLIEAGRVKVNGQVVTTLGVKVDPAVDRIEVDGRPIRPLPTKVYYVLYKPTGVISSCRDPEGRVTVLDLLHGVKERVYPVGRLDYDSEGLVFLTNDGETAQILGHPRYQVRKSYLVEVQGFPSEKDIARLRRGIKLSDGWTAPAHVEVVQRLQDTTILTLDIHEGRNRQIRRMCDAIGHPVVFLKRFRIGPLDLEGLEPGQFRRLRPQEIKELLAFTARAKEAFPRRK
ncbi:MAG: rRNA pseudouridine synthase [Firmicutes bacterium]|nr:rRNA pseudouridine synthase [Bacillota bacterium]